MRKDFIKLDRKLIRVLGLNKAVVFCHLLGIQDTINNKRDKQDAIYQQQERLLYEVGLSKATLIKTIKELEKDKLLHTIKGTEGNKTKYLIDKYNYNKLMDIIDDLEIKSSKKNKQNASVLKKDVLNLYYEWCNNNTTSSDNFNTTSSDNFNTTSSDNFNTTNKDLKEKEKLKKIKSSRQLLANNRTPITINFTNNGVLQESITYNFIPKFFKDEYTESDMYNILNKSSNVNYNEIQILEYF